MCRGLTNPLAKGAQSEANHPSNSPKPEGSAVTSAAYSKNGSIPRTCAPRETKGTGCARGFGAQPMQNKVVGSSSVGSLGPQNRTESTTMEPRWLGAMGQSSHPQRRISAQSEDKYCDRDGAHGTASAHGNGKVQARGTQARLHRVGAQATASAHETGRLPARGRQVHFHRVGEHEAVSAHGNSRLQGKCTQVHCHRVEAQTAASAHRNGRLQTRSTQTCFHRREAGPREWRAAIIGWELLESLMLFAG